MAPSCLKVFRAWIEGQARRREIILERFIQPYRPTLRSFVRWSSSLPSHCQPTVLADAGTRNRHVQGEPSLLLQCEFAFTVHTVNIPFCSQLMMMSPGVFFGSASKSPHHFDSAQKSHKLSSSLPGLSSSVDDPLRQQIPASLGICVWFLSGVWRRSMRAVRFVFM